MNDETQSVTLTPTSRRLSPQATLVPNSGGFSQVTTESELDSVPVITMSKKVKNPKRVEQGKRLAEISKQAKARKKAETQSREDATIISPPSAGTEGSIGTVGKVALLGLTLTAIGTYYGCKTYSLTSFNAEAKQCVTP